MAAAEFGALLLADFDHRIALEHAKRLRPSPHPFGARESGPFGGGPASITAIQHRRELPPPSQFMLDIMAGLNDHKSSSDAHVPDPHTADTQPSAPARITAGPSTSSHAPDFKPASSRVTPYERAAFAESSTMAQNRHMQEESAGLECSYMGIGTGHGAWDAGSEETARRVATLQARLQQRLGPEYVSTRAGPSGGPKVSYIEGWKAIDLANEVFGFNGWSSSIVSIDVDYLEEHPETGRVNVAVSVTVRITLRDGTYHEDVGYGSMDNSKSRAAALEKSKKEAVTDALKRTLRTFGRVLGNCLYDKQFLRDVGKVSLPPVKFDPSALHRRPEFAQAMGNKAQTQNRSSEADGTSSAGDTTAMAPPPLPAPATRAVTGPAPVPASRPTGPSAADSDVNRKEEPNATRPTTTAQRSKTMGPISTTAPAPSVIATNSETGATAQGAAEKARLAEQRRAEAQKRLARTKSMQATSNGGANAMPAPPLPAQPQQHEAQATSGAATPSKPAAVPVRMELPTFGPRIQRADTSLGPGDSSKEAAGNTIAEASRTSSTPFGPRFMKAQLPHDSGVFFDDEGWDQEDDGGEDRSMTLVDGGECEAGHGQGLAEKRGFEGMERSIRAPSVGRFTGLTPNSAQLLRSGTTSLSAAAGGSQTATTFSPSTAARKDSLCGPLQPRRSNTEQNQRAPAQAQAPGGNQHANNTTASAKVVGGGGGIENVGLAERVSGVGVGVGKVRGVAVSGGGAGSTGSFGTASSLSAAAGARSAKAQAGAGGTHGGLKRASAQGLGMGAMTDGEAAKRMRR
ncbi:hypothetical protein V8E36_004655 [Tilletia maclaganii]